LRSAIQAKHTEADFENGCRFLLITDLLAQARTRREVEELVDGWLAQLNRGTGSTAGRALVPAARTACGAELAE
jgi:hypothetical protein